MWVFITSDRKMEREMDKRVGAEKQMLYQAVVRKRELRQRGRERDV